MASHTVNLSDEAYRRLRNAKREGESFSDVVNRVLGKASILDLVGVLGAKEADDFRRHARDMGERARQGMDRAWRRLRQPEVRE